MSFKISIRKKEGKSISYRPIFEKNNCLVSISPSRAFRILHSLKGEKAFTVTVTDITDNHIISITNFLIWKLKNKLTALVILLKQALCKFYLGAFSCTLNIFLIVSWRPKSSHEHNSEKFTICLCMTPPNIWAILNCPV